MERDGGTHWVLLRMKDDDVKEKKKKKGETTKKKHRLRPNLSSQTYRRAMHSRQQSMRMIFVNISRNDFLIPKNLVAVRRVRHATVAINSCSLYRHYSRIQQQQMEDELGYEDGENDETDSPVVVVPPESQYFGRTSNED